MHKIIYITIVLTLSFGLLLETVGSPASVFAQANQTATAGNQTAGNQTAGNQTAGNQTDGSNITSSADTTSDNATTAEQFENITHGGGPGAGATNQSER
jgi:hypothetical protein